MGGLISALASFLSAGSVLRWIAFKTVAYALMVVVLPVVLWNVMSDWTLYLLGYVIGQLPPDSFTYQMTGLAGWFAVQLQLPQVITVLVSALATRMMISAILRV